MYSRIGQYTITFIIHNTQWSISNSFINFKYQLVLNCVIFIGKIVVLIYFMPKLSDDGFNVILIPIVENYLLCILKKFY